MSTNTTERAVLPARSHAQAAELFRRPFAPGAIGFRAMMKVPLNGNPFGGAQVAAYIGAQSVLQRLNAVVPGGEQQREAAYRFGINLVMYALTGNYKAESLQFNGEKQTAEVEIKRLVYGEGYTLSGARQALGQARRTESQAPAAAAVKTPAAPVGTRDADRTCG